MTIHLLQPAGFAAVSALLAIQHLSAQDTTGTTALPEVIVSGKAEDLLGSAPAASKGQASAEEIASRPYLRRGEILETIPGVIITQHAGGGKANQYFLRGFNLDHGTDFATSLEGMPLNLRTHAHGQGYTDLNPLLPELINRVDYVKGTYTAANGDLSTAGSANFTLFDALPHNLATVEVGEDGYYRGLVAGTFRLDDPRPIELAPGKQPSGKGLAAPAAQSLPRGLTYALEYNTYDGPFTLSEDFVRWNGLLRYWQGDDDNHFSLTFMGYRADWNSADQIPQRAVDSGLVSRLGYIDPTTGGDSQRYSLNAAWKATDGDVITQANIYGIHYALNLFSNFTYNLDYPERGDQFEQSESRWIVGANVSRTWQKQSLFGHETDFTLGLQTRHDIIDDIGLYRTDQRRRFLTVRLDDVYEADAGIYGEATTRWSDWFRTTIGLRGDVFYFKTSGQDSRNGGSEWDGIVSPKISAIFGPWKETELYVNFGTGFHSNDARGTTTRVDPVSGESVSPVDPLVRTMGAELGIRTQIIPSLTSTLAAFWLESDSELVYIGDAGTNEAGPGSRRYGIEWANYWRPVSWLSLDAEVAVTHSRFTGAGDEDRIPSSVPVMFSGGLTIGAHGDDDGFFGTLRARAFSRRPLVEDNSRKGKSSFLVNGAIGYRKGNWEGAVECLNIFDRKDNDIEYYYASRLRNEPEGVEDVHFHPTEPRTVRFRLTYRF